MRAAQKRGLQAAATNLKVPNRDQVEFVLIGDNEKIEEIISYMKSGAPLNSWKAQVDELKELTTPTIAFAQHQVSTANVDSFNWSPNVTFYI